MKTGLSRNYRLRVDCLLKIVFCRLRLGHPYWWPAVPGPQVSPPIIPAGYPSTRVTTKLRVGSTSVYRRRTNNPGSSVLQRVVVDVSSSALPAGLAHWICRALALLATLTVLTA